MASRGESSSRILRRGPQDENRWYTITANSDLMVPTGVSWWMKRLLSRDGAWVEMVQVVFDAVYAQLV